jgi:hypothetical protein
MTTSRPARRKLRFGAEYRWIVLVAPLLVGCALGNRHAYHTVLAEPNVSGSGALGVATHDQRAYVVAGGKDPQFVGLQRGGYGNPFDVRTAENRPLADDMTQALTNSLSRKGFQVLPIVVAASDSVDRVRDKLAQSGAPRAVLLTLREWKSDTYANTALMYDVTLRVVDRSGQVLGEKRIQGRDNLGGDMWNPPAHAKQAVPRAFKTKVEELLGDESIARALRTSP